MNMEINYLNLLFFLSLLFSCSYLLTRFLKNQSAKINLIDIPNARSSHVRATPRGGGLSFVVCFLSALPILYYYNFLQFNFFLAYLIAGILISLLGFYDDIKNLSAKSRLIVQALAALSVLVCLNGFPAVTIMDFTTSKLALNIFGMLFIMWMVNLYNFMDGIDAIASLEAICVCFSLVVVYYLTNHHELIIFPLILASIVAGFLAWNLPPAKIFMGDVGSGFLGLIFSILAVQSAIADSKFFSVFLILLAVFIIDTTLTLLDRIIHNKNFFEAHCSHLYQNLAKHYNKHNKVNFLILLINIFWLLPWAIFVALGYISELTGLFISYLLLCLVYLILQKKVFLRFC